MPLLHWISTVERNPGMSLVPQRAPAAAAASRVKEQQRGEKRSRAERDASDSEFTTSDEEEQPVSKRAKVGKANWTRASLMAWCDRLEARVQELGGDLPSPPPVLAAPAAAAAAPAAAAVHGPAARTLYKGREWETGLEEFRATMTALATNAKFRELNPWLTDEEANGIATFNVPQSARDKPWLVTQDYEGDGKLVRRVSVSRIKSRKSDLRPEIRPRGAQAVPLLRAAVVYRPELKADVDQADARGLTCSHRAGDLPGMAIARTNVNPWMACRPLLIVCFCRSVCLL